MYTADLKRYLAHNALNTLITITIGLNKERPTTNVNILLEFRSRFVDGVYAETMRLNKMFILYRDIQNALMVFVMK